MNTWKKFCCWIGWHRISSNSVTVYGYFDGCSYHAKCEWCNKDVMQDSQGNWF